MSQVLENILIERQLIDAQKMRAFLDRAKKTSLSLEECLIKAEVYTTEQILEILENHYFCPSVDLQTHEFNPEALALLPRRVSERYHVLPLAVNGNTLEIAFADPDNARARESIASMVQCNVSPRVAMESAIDGFISEHYDRMESLISGDIVVEDSAEVSVEITHVSPSIELPKDLGTRSPPDIIDSLLHTAATYGVSDVHLQPAEEHLKVRFRLDGILHTVSTLDVELIPPMVSRVKILGEMNIAEHRVPQDGRHAFVMGDTAVDLRISTVPSQFGEKVVCRLLNKNLNLLNLDNLHLPPAIREEIDECVRSPQGFYLVTGPTGSGKSTTLYAMLAATDREHENVVTLEDPIEYTLAEITQVPIKEATEMTFAAGLRAMLRQDPDVILVGEIRDLETVEIACRAALTGHKVFSTIHTNDTIQAITRLVDMGTPPFLVTATLRGVLGQRLIRSICKNCRQSREANEAELAILGYPKDKDISFGRGCEHCAQTGYAGRVALFEFFKLEENMHRLVLERASPYSIRHAATSNGMILMKEYARRAVLNGVTTVAEIQRAVLCDQGQDQLCKNCQRVISIDFSVCPFCQNQLHESCPECGNALDAGWDACLSCGHEIEREWQKIFCRHCLAPVESSWTDCFYCGVKL